MKKIFLSLLLFINISFADELFANYRHGMGYAFNIDHNKLIGLGGIISYENLIHGDEMRKSERLDYALSLIYEHEFEHVFLDMAIKNRLNQFRGKLMEYEVGIFPSLGKKISLSENFILTVSFGGSLSYEHYFIIDDSSKNYSYEIDFDNYPSFGINYKF